MHAQLLTIGWLLAGQLTPATEFAPNVTIGRPAAEGDAAADVEPLGDEPVALEPIPESSPGVEFRPRTATRGAGNALRSAAPVGAAARLAASPDEEAGVARTSYANGSNRPVAELLVKHGLAPPDAEGARLVGQPASLVTLLDRATDRTQRAAVIRGYWTLLANVALANWAAEEVEFIRGVSPEHGGAERSEIAAARLDALARWQEANLAAVASQHDLAQLCRLSVTTPENLPLPRDLPLVTAYTTNYERIFANRTPTGTARQLAATIPLQHELLTTRAESVSKGREALKEVRHAYQQGTADLALLLASQDRLNAAQQGFLQIVRRYNESVATYAAEVGGNLDNATFVSLLIPSPTGLRDGTRTASRSGADVNARQGYATPGYSGQGYSAGTAPSIRTPRSTTDGAVRPTGEFAPAAPRGGSNWGPANRAGGGAPGYDAGGGYGPPPTRFQP